MSGPETSNQNEKLKVYMDFKAGGIKNFKISEGIYVSPIPEVFTGFVRVLEILESPGILLSHFPGLESPGKVMLVLESPGNLLN